MSDDVIVRFGADISELEAALEKVMADAKGLSNSLADTSSQAGDQGSGQSDGGQPEKEKKGADEGNKKKIEGELQLAEALKQEADAKEKLASIKYEEGDGSQEEKKNAAVDALNASLAIQALKLEKAGMSAEDVKKHIESLRDANEGLAKANVAKDIAAEYEKYLKPVGDVFGNTVKGMMLHQKNLGMAVKSSLQSMLGSYISMGTQSLTKWVSSKLGMISAEKLFGAAVQSEAAKTKAVEASSQAAQTTVVQAETVKRSVAEEGSQTAQTVAVTSGDAARTGSGEAAAASQAATQSTGIMKHAGSAAASVYDDVAQIPYVGWLLAPPAAATAFAAVAAFSAAGGWERVPFDGAMTELHKDEMVLPATVANTVRAASSAVGAYGLPSQSKQWANPAQPQVASTAAEGTGNGAMTMHYSPNISAIDTRGARDFLDQHGRYMVDVLSRQQRNFAQVKK